MAVADAGATSHFHIPGALTKPLNITLPEGNKIRSTHTCALRAPWLRPAARDAHIVPGLMRTSRLLIKALCDANCKVAYDKDDCCVFYEGTLIWRGIRDKSTGL